MEHKMMELLDFKLNSWTFFDLAMLKVALHFNSPKNDSKGVLQQLYLSKKKPSDKDSKFKEAE